MATPTTALEFFEHPDLQFPLDRTTDNFQAFVEERLGKFLTLVRSINASDEITRGILDQAGRIEEVCQRLRVAIDHYLRGAPFRALEAFEPAVRSIRPELTVLIKPVDHPFLKELYRIRREPEPGTVFPRRELFHVPFHLQHKVTRQRYSIPGHPCLYLGGSLFICWEELGRSNPDSMQIARFEPAPGQTIKVLDFMARPRHVAQGVRERANANDDPHQRFEFVALAVCWPLMAMASIRRKHGDSPFIAEYIVPQLLLQWLVEQDGEGIDGVAYSSVRCRAHCSYPALIANVVLPSRKFAPTGYCSRLAEKLAVTEPVAWSLLARADFPYTNPFHASATIEFLPGQDSLYMKSQFCMVEGKVRAMPATPFTSNG